MSGTRKVASVVWAVLIGLGLIALAGSVMLPSTKRARVDWDEVRRLQQEHADAEAAAATQPTTDSAAATTTTPTTAP